MRFSGLVVTVHVWGNWLQLWWAEQMCEGLASSVWEWANAGVGLSGLGRRERGGAVGGWR